MAQHALDLSKFLTKCTQIVLIKLARDYFTLLLPLRTCSLLELMSPMHLLKPRPQNKASTCNPIKLSTSGGLTINNVNQFPLAKSFQSYRQCRVTPNCLDSGKSTRTPFYGSSASHPRFTNPASTPAILMVNANLQTPGRRLCHCCSQRTNCRHPP